MSRLFYGWKVVRVVKGMDFVPIKNTLLLDLFVRVINNEKVKMTK